MNRFCITENFKSHSRSINICTVFSIFFFVCEKVVGHWIRIEKIALIVFCAQRQTKTLYYFVGVLRDGTNRIIIKSNLPNNPPTHPHTHTLTLCGNLKWLPFFHETIFSLSHSLSLRLFSLSLSLSQTMPYDYLCMQMFVDSR